MQTRLQIFAIAVMVSCGLAAFADPPHADTHDHEIPEIIVTADPLGAADRHFVAPVTVLDEKALRNESMRSIGEAVADQLGVTSSDFGAGVGRPVIRGLGGARVRVLEDGIGSMDVSTISADHGVTIEPLFANQIEILRGPATLLYGSGASGGLVNVSNGRILDFVPERVDARLYGHYDTASDGWLGAFKADAAIGSEIAIHVDGLTRDTEDVDIPGYARVEPEPGDRKGTLPNSDADAYSYSGGASFITEAGFIGFNVSRYDHEYGAPGAHHHVEDESESDAGPASGGTRIDQDQTRYDIEAQYSPDRFYLERARIRWGYNDYAHDEIEPGGDLGTAFENDEWEGRIELIVEPIGRWQGVVGVQLRDKDFEAIGEEAFVPPSKLDSQALFAFQKADLRNFHVDLGVRVETQDAESVGFAKSPEHNLISVSGGSTWTGGERYEAGVSLSRSQRAPSIEELFARGPHLATNTFEIGDVNLGEETSVNVDVFWRRLEGRIRFDFTFFYNDIDDFVFLRSNDLNNDGIADRVEEDFLETGEIVDEDDALLLVTQTQKDAEFWGFELEGELTFIDGSRGIVELRLWADYVDGELADGSDVPRLPPLRIGGGLEWESDAAYAGLSVMRVTEQDDPAPLETPTDGYTMVNVHAGYTVRAARFGDFTVFARGTNLLDDTARRTTSFVKDLAPLPGISGLFGIRVRF